MNTGQYYFDKLPKDVQEKFKANFVKEYSETLFDDYMNRTKFDHGIFIGCAFDWRKSNEKLKYWRKIAETKYP